jgi:mannose/cellobiose epimerase-like protein (N-acyl-D-glucosamine 2-epimerase family)
VSYGADNVSIGAALAGVEPGHWFDSERLLAAAANLAETIIIMATAASAKQRRGRIRRGLSAGARLGLRPL